jgi:hypothetical protein
MYVLSFDSVSQPKTCFVVSRHQPVNNYHKLRSYCGLDRQSLSRTPLDTIRPVWIPVSPLINVLKNFYSVVYTSCSLGALIQPAGWSQWSAATPNTANVLFAEYASTGNYPLFSGNSKAYATPLRRRCCWDTCIVLQKAHI